MRILLVEDDGAVAIPLKGYLEDMGHTVFSAENLSAAKSYHEDQQIDCYIVDSNMPPAGLTDSEKADTEKGLLSGWVWFRNYVLTDDPSARNRCLPVWHGSPACV